MSGSAERRRRRRLVCANWKMHLVRAEAEAYCAVLAAEAGELLAEVALFPSFPLLPSVAHALARTRIPVGLGGQDLHPEPQGAFTGDVSGPQLRDAGCRWVLCGHSERRRDHGESDAWVGRKVAAAAACGLHPLLCVGERREERQAGETLAVLERQLRAGLASGPAEFSLAYEPVWAIGTGETATPPLIAEAHGFLRALLAEVAGKSQADAIRILYGGSVTAENAVSLVAVADVDGFLVGGASLDPRRFLAIIGACG